MTHRLLLVVPFGVAGLVVGCAVAADAPGGIVHDSGAKLGNDSAAGSAFDSGSNAPTGDDAQTAIDAPTQQTNCPTPYTGTLATWDFTGEAGNQASTMASSSATGITAAAVSRSTSLTATNGLNSINGSNWTTSTKVDATKYYTFTITPASGCSLDVSSIAIDSTASGTGPADGAVATSDDNFGTTTAFNPGSATSVTVAVTGGTSALEIRVFGFGASSTAGTMRIQNTLKVTGALK